MNYIFMNSFFPFSPAATAILVLTVTLSALGYDAGWSVQARATMGKEQCYQNEELPAQQEVLSSLNQYWPTWQAKQRRACYWKDAVFIEGK